MLGKMLGLVGAAVFVAAALVEMTERLTRRGKKPRGQGQATPETEPRDPAASPDDDGRTHGE